MTLSQSESAAAMLSAGALFLQLSPNLLLNGWDEAGPPMRPAHP